MSLLGKAALAMWWDIAPQVREDFEDWHAHEHFPERLAIPGFQRASRWAAADGGEGMFVMYELDDYDTLASPRYLARLNAPTPWSTRLMPHHRNMVRGQCRVLESRGGLTARHALTIRLSPQDGQEQALRASLRFCVEALHVRPGLVGIHLLQHQPPLIPPTEEQKIRGLSDKGLDHVLVVCGYDAASLKALGAAELSDAALYGIGAGAQVQRSMYTLAYSATPGDMACST